MKILFLSVLLAYFVAPGTALKCFRCVVHPSLCFFKETCKDNERCYSGNSTVGDVTIYRSGCIEKEKCGKTLSETQLNVKHTLIAECCDFDNCNGATAAQLSVLAISVMVLVWFVGFQ
ncbi:sperm acrosome membrane-associated protein 4-like [Hypanus sabinus]|uniref:sperm acrosome membrane-associated protein 4-like n=1 Tax=Hypanus sabinus TaxID=79690 RepID=UPI0028C4F7F3|nr:sperm acrosome membrane-associated protein 4-like [Hypanus sabinus]